MDVIALLEKVLGLGTSLWRRHRFGRRVRIALGWDHAPVVFLPGPNPSWRSVSIVATAPKAEEFVIAKGTLEAKPSGGRWVKLCDLDDVLSLPVVVEPNRQWEGSISGGSLAKKIEAHSQRAEALAIRLTLEDLHRSKIRSEPLEVTMTELRREQRS